MPLTPEDLELIRAIVREEIRGQGAQIQEPLQVEAHLPAIRAQLLKEFQPGGLLHPGSGPERPL